MAAPGWYGDPTRAGRVRYWDGSAWTEHVSEAGATSSDPIAGVPPAPPSAPGVDEAAAPAVGGAPYPPTPLGRAGFGVAAAGAILAAAASGSVAVTQDALGSERTVEVAGPGWIALCVIVAALCLGAAFAPWPWARIAGVTVSGVFGAFVAIGLIAIRGDEIFVQDTDVELDTSGWLMVLGCLLLFAGTALALAGLRRPTRGPDPAARPADGKAVASLVLGIIAILLMLTAAPAIALGLYALDDVRATGGRIGGRGMAIAGLVLGIVALSLWALGLILGMLLAQP